MLGDADPVKAQLLDVLETLDHALIGPGAGVTVVRPGGHRPLGLQRLRRAVARGFEERDLHGRRGVTSSARRPSGARSYWPPAARWGRSSRSRRTRGPVRG